MANRGGGKNKKEIDPEILMRKKFRAKCLFRALGRLVMANTYWLIEDVDHYEGVEDVKRRVQQAVRGKTKKKQLLNKLTILKLHPDLAGRLAAQGELTKESANEQRSAGLDNITADQKTVIDENNKRYKAKFGFPFIICARENKVQSIISGLQDRYKNSREDEINTGINEVKKICKLRILDIVEDV